MGRGPPPAPPAGDGRDALAEGCDFFFGIDFSLTMDLVATAFFLTGGGADLLATLRFIDLDGTDFLAAATRSVRRVAIRSVILAGSLITDFAATMIMETGKKGILMRE